MAMRKMTFAIPEPLAERFAKRVASRDRSHYVAEALSERLARQEQRLIASCEAANAESDVAAIEREFDALTDAVAEPWSDAG